MNLIYRLINGFLLSVIDPWRALAKADSQMLVSASVNAMPESIHLIASLFFLHVALIPLRHKER